MLPIIFDDWTQIRRECKNAESLIINAATMYASVNLVLYFLIHSDTSNAWGVDKVGASLKDGFVKLLVTPQYDASGKPVRENTKALIRFPTSEERRVALINHAILEAPSLPDYLIESESEPKQLSNKETDILSTYDDMLKANGSPPSLKAVARAYPLVRTKKAGGVGGNQLKGVRRVLDEHGRALKPKP